MNEKIRKRAKDSNVKLWELAEAFGISDANFSRRLRREFAPDEQQQAFALIDEISRAKKKRGEKNGK